MMKIRKILFAGIVGIFMLALAACGGNVLAGVDSVEFEGTVKQEFEINETFTVTVKVYGDDFGNNGQQVTLKLNADGQIDRAVSTGINLVENAGYTIAVNGFNTETVGSRTFTVKVDTVSVASMYTVKAADPLAKVGTGTQSDPYQISTPEQLINMDTAATYVENAPVTYFKLMADINLFGYDYQPLEMTYAFELDGNGKSILSMNYAAATLMEIKVDDTAAKCAAGLFKIISKNATVKNLAIKNATISTPSYASALVGFAESGTIVFENVTVENTNITSTHYVGAFVGQISASSNVAIKDSTVKGLFISAVWNSVQNDNGDKAGGFVGQSFGTLRIENPTVGATVYAVRDVALLVGFAVKTKTTFAGDATILNGSSATATKTITGAQSETLNSSGFPAVACCGVLVGCLGSVNATDMANANLSSFVNIAGLKIYNKDGLLLAYEGVNGEFTSSVTGVVTVSSTAPIACNEFEGVECTRLFGAYRISKYYTPAGVEIPA